MPFKRIDDEKRWNKRKKRCRHPEHNPPGHICLPPGLYEYTCPGCGEVRIIQIDGVVFGSGFGVGVIYKPSRCFHDHART